jgi:DNA-binding CsgD family transcriptional regulator
MKLKQKKGYGFKTLRDDDLEILQLICRKLTNEQIGEQLHIDSKW